MKKSYIPSFCREYDPHDIYILLGMDSFYRKVGRIMCGVQKDNPKIVPCQCGKYILKIFGMLLKILSVAYV